MINNTLNNIIDDIYSCIQTAEIRVLDLQQESKKFEGEGKRVEKNMVDSSIRGLKSYILGLQFSMDIVRDTKKNQRK